VLGVVGDLEVRVRFEGMDVVVLAREGVVDWVVDWESLRIEQNGNLMHGMLSWWRWLAVCLIYDYDNS